MAPRHDSSSLSVTQHLHSFINPQHTYTTTTITASMSQFPDHTSVASDETYQHWESTHPGNDRVATPTPGYDNHNGLRKHNYVPTTTARSAAVTHISHPAGTYHQPQLRPANSHFYYPYASGYGPVVQYPQSFSHVVPQYSYDSQQVAQQHAHSGATYYTYPQQQYPAHLQQYYPEFHGLHPDQRPRPQQHDPYGPPPAHYQMYQPQTSGQAAPPATAWMGRTKIEVDADNIRIAAREKVYDQRKMAPTGVADAQMFWVVETDESQTIR